MQVTNDLLEHCHAASVAKMLGPQATRLPNDQAQKLTALGAVISAGTLARVWQMLLRALTRSAARPIPPTPSKWPSSASPTPPTCQDRKRR